MKTAEEGDFIILNYRATHVPTDSIWYIDSEGNVAVRTPIPGSNEYDYVEFKIWRYAY